MLIILFLLEDRLDGLGNKKCCFLVTLFCCKLRYGTNKSCRIVPFCSLCSSNTTAVIDLCQTHLACMGCAELINREAYSQSCY